LRQRLPEDGVLEANRGLLVYCAACVGAKLGKELVPIGRCRRHDAPRADHRCGVYAFRTRAAAEDLLRRCAPARLAGCRPVALGAVSLWGRVIPHREGWRAQFAYPYELFVLGGDDEVAFGLRDRYAVDVIRG